MPKGLPEDVNRRSENTMAKRKKKDKAKRQKMIYKTQHRKLRLSDTNLTNTCCELRCSGRDKVVVDITNHWRN